VNEKQNMPSLQLTSPNCAMSLKVGGIMERDGLGTGKDNRHVQKG
jgi:hypothetical protein